MYDSLIRNTEQSHVSREVHRAPSAAFRFWIYYCTPLIITFELRVVMRSHNIVHVLRVKLMCDLPEDLLTSVVILVYQKNFSSIIYS